MRMGAWDSQLRGHRGRIQPKARLREARRARVRWAELESLEQRTLLATIPAATAVGGPQNISSLFENLGGNETSSLVAVDPTDPTKLVSVWVNDDPVELAATDNLVQGILEAAYSINSGQSWIPLLGEPTNGLGIPVNPELLDPSTSGLTVPYKFVTDPNLGFDDSGNFYITTEYSTAAQPGASTSGAVVLQKYNFTGSAPAAQTFINNEQTPSPYGGGGFIGGGGANDLKIIYQWLNSGANDVAVNATMTVDDNLSTAPTGVATLPDAYSGNVYVSWASVDINTAIPIPDFNPNRIKLEVSSDGGNNFSPLTIAGNGNFLADPIIGNEQDSSPAITVAQGRSGDTSPLGNESGQSGDAGIPAGQVALSFDDFGNNQIVANTVSAGRDYSFGAQYNGQVGVIPIGTYLTGGTAFALPVSISNTTGLNSLTATLNIISPSGAGNLGAYLEAPSGDMFLLFLNQTIDTSPTASTSITSQGLPGGNVGVVTYTNNNIGSYAMGTTFADTATRDIFDPNAGGTNANASPYVGQYQPEFFGLEPPGVVASSGTLDGFLAQELASKAGINGTWHLVTFDSQTSTTATPSFIVNWSLSFGRGLSPDIRVQVPGTAGLVVPGSITGTFLPSVSTASPIGIGPGVVMAEDNTLGANSPYEGRIYAAFVGYYNIDPLGIQNPASNTDIFLTYSDDGGRTWSTAVEVNDDEAVLDGYSESNETNPNDQFTGRVQFQPAIAVNPTTGTVVLSWRDGRDDPSGNLVATYITASIDGGKTFSPQTYANPNETAINAITGQTEILGPQADNESSANSTAEANYGYGTSMGLAVYDGQLYPIWAGNFNEGSLSTMYRPMVIAAGPRIVNSTMGPIPLSEAESGSVSFNVTFDRPINPPGITASFTTADVLVFYHDTTNGDASIPLDVVSVTPITSSGVGPDNKFGFTRFTVVFDPADTATGGASGIVNYTGTYSYMVTPDDEAGDPIESAIPSFVIAQVTQQPIGPVVAPAIFNGATNVPLPIPSSGTGGTGTADDLTTSVIPVPGFANQVITGITVNLTLTHNNDSDLAITLTAPNGQASKFYVGTFNGPVTFNNQAFTVNGLAGGLVGGNYTLTIDDTQSNNTGTLTSWSVTIDSQMAAFGLQSGAPMDQNADGTADENPITTAYTGTTPGDVYAVPAPTGMRTYTSAASILTFPFNQNTLPLSVPGPQILSTTAIGTSGQTSSGGYGSNDLLLDDTSSRFQVTFDRPMLVNSAAAGQTPTPGSFNPSQVLSITGPLGSITAPQSFTSSDVNVQIPAATSPTAPGTKTSSVTISSDNTLQIADITVELSIASTSDSALTAVLVAPNGTTIPLFSGVGGFSGNSFINTVFDDSAETAINTGTAPFTGSYKPEYTLNSATLTSLQGMIADGTWQLELTNSTGTAPTLDTWSLSITPQINVAPVAATETTINGAKYATAFTISFPQQMLSGTYTIQLGPNIQDQFGDEMDVNQNAGLDVLRDTSQNSPTVTVQYTAADLPKTILAAKTNQSGTLVNGQVESTIVEPDSFIIQGDTTTSGLSGMQLQLNLSFAVDSNLTATLSHYDSQDNLLGQVELFSGVGSGVHTSNFTSTVFDDNAGTPIADGGAPFFGTFNPQESLATAFAGQNAQGTWTLVVQNASTSITGTFNSWSLNFQKPAPTSGLGETGSDDATVSFRIFTLSQTDALSSEAWTPVGPASIGSGSGTAGGEVSGSGASGRMSAISIDTSDPSGNTVYAAGASGGVWRTTDFLTTNPAGPTWVPLTNFGPTNAVNIGGITLFERNNNPNDTVVIVATGEGNTGTPGVGFLISYNAGQTWTLDDSTVNVDASGNPLPIGSASRDREFVGDTSYQVTVDPQLTPNGQIIIYAAMSGPTGGIWRSEDSGQTWELMLSGEATSVVLDPNSGTVLNPTTGTLVQGNLQVVYAGIRGVGVEMSPNQGQVWNLMSGLNPVTGAAIGNPLIVDKLTGKNVNPVAGPTPNGPEGRIVLAVPNATGNAAFDDVYEGWLYAAVATPAGGLDGLFVTKDFGDNWTEVHIPTLAALATTTGGYNQAIPTNNVNDPNYAITGGGAFGAGQGNYDLILTVDPADPNIVYLGGSRDGGQTALIRVDTTNLWDAHSLVATSDQSNGQLADAALAPLTLDKTDGEVSPGNYLDLIRNPGDPFGNSTIIVSNAASFTNNGAGATWIPFDMPGTDYHSVATMIDPTTGLPRLIFGNDQGIWSVLDNNGTFETTIGLSDSQAGVNRNGNLQVTQFYYGAAQPSSAAALVAGALFYGSAQDNGGPFSDPGVVGNGDISWSGPGGDATGVATDQQGNGTVYQYFWPCCGGADTDFFQVNGVGRTTGLLQSSNGLPTPDPQWPFLGGANFAVNPVNGSDVVISSATGNIFTTTNEGVTWFDVGLPSVFGTPNSFSLALAYGAPIPPRPRASAT